MIEAEKNICTGCMKCVSICPFTVLEEANGHPRIKEGKPCIKCFHCAAACPEGAITYRDKPAALMQNEFGESEDSFDSKLKAHILNRRSYRHFSAKKVPRTEIEEALELASWAPSAKNQHPTKWIIIESQEYLNKIMDAIVEYSKETGVSPEIVSELDIGNNVVMGTANTMILAYANDQAISPETDTAIAMTTAELYLQSKGIGTCWAGYFKRMCNTVPKIKDLLPKIPSACSFYGAFMIGYPEDEEYGFIPDRIKRADIKVL